MSVVVLITGGRELFSAHPQVFPPDVDEQEQQEPDVSVIFMNWSLTTGPVRLGAGREYPLPCSSNCQLSSEQDSRCCRFSPS